MELTCSVKIKLLASYYLVEKKELAQALNDYVHCGTTEHFRMEQDGMKLVCEWVGYLVFNNYADMVKNLEKHILDTLHFELGIKWVENWNIHYKIIDVGGYDE